MDVLNLHEMVIFPRRADMCIFVRRYTGRRFRDNQNRFKCYHSYCPFRVKLYSHRSAGFYYIIDREHVCEPDVNYKVTQNVAYCIGHLKPYFRKIYNATGSNIECYEELKACIGYIPKQFHRKFRERLRYHLTEPNFKADILGLNFWISKKSTITFRYTGETPVRLIESIDELKSFLKDLCEMVNRKEYAWYVKNKYLFNNNGAAFFNGKSLVQVIEAAVRFTDMEYCPMNGRTPLGYKLIQNILQYRMHMSIKPALKILPKEFTGFSTEKDNAFRTRPVIIRQESDMNKCLGFGCMSISFSRKQMVNNECNIESCYPFWEMVRQVETKNCLRMENLFYLFKTGRFIQTYGVEQYRQKPLISLYHQVSGYSVFHFVPVLVGFYLQYLTTNGTLEQLRQALVDIDRLKIGSVMTLDAGESAVVLPTGAFAIYVPPKDLNPEFRVDSVSITLAADMAILSREELEQTKRVKKN
mmetsp:Transcript_16295/g.18450  ORF Transcript_16295/g.18450 Transcript_16295/m.18450 type:complete len:471 (-) Transcript_16295:94-1506(-)